MVTNAAAIAEFETQDGLRLRVGINISDDLGAAEGVLDDLLNRINDYIAEQDSDAGALVFAPETDEPSQPVDFNTYDPDAQYCDLCGGFH